MFIQSRALGGALARWVVGACPPGGGGARSGQGVGGSIMRARNPKPHHPKVIPPHHLLTPVSHGNFPARPPKCNTPSPPECYNPPGSWGGDCHDAIIGFRLDVHGVAGF